MRQNGGRVVHVTLMENPCDSIASGMDLGQILVPGMPLHEVRSATPLVSAFRGNRPGDCHEGLRCRDGEEGPLTGVDRLHRLMSATTEPGSQIQ